VSQGQADHTNEFESLDRRISVAAKTTKTTTTKTSFMPLMETAWSTKGGGGGRGSKSKRRRETSLLLSLLLGNVDGALLLLDRVQQDAVVLGHEPFHGLFLRDAMVGSNRALLFAALIDVVTSASQDHVKVQTVNTDARIVFDAQIDMFLKAEAKGSHVGKAILAQLVLDDLETLLENLLGLGASDGAVAGDLLVTTDAERSHRVTRLGEDWGLS